MILAITVSSLVLAVTLITIALAYLLNRFNS
jgi:hypothetical protein